MHKSKDIISPNTLQLLRDLQNDRTLGDFFLVGGTALALQLGHRLSVDLDLFCLDTFSTQDLINYLSNKYSFSVAAIAPETIKGLINGIKVDFIAHKYPLVNDIIREENLRLASLEDIGAMKLNAISHSGQRLKDFIDLYFLLEHFSLNQLIEAYEKKYSNANILIPLKALTYFEDIDPEIDKPIMKVPLSFSTIKKRLENSVKHPKKKYN